MKLNVIRILVILAKTTQSKAKLAENAKLSRQTVTNALKTGECKPETAGKIAKALGVDVTEIIETEN
mgnify:CR=1 FL=1